MYTETFFVRFVADVGRWIVNFERDCIMGHEYRSKKAALKAIKTEAEDFEFDSYDVIELRWGGNDWINA